MSTDESLSQLLEPINAMAQDAVAELCGLVLAFLINPIENDLQSDLRQFATEKSIPIASLKTISQGLLIFLQEAIRGGYGLNQLAERCSYGMRLNEEVTAILVKLWKRSSSKLASSLLQRSLNNNSLVDMDWTFGVTSASDDCSHVGKTYLQLKLVIANGNKSARNSTSESQKAHEVIFIELSLDQFYQFLASLEKCKAYLDYVSPAQGTQS